MSVNPSVEDVVPGTHLIVRRRGYWHHGIYVNSGSVIQYAGWFHSALGLVEELPLQRFSRDRAVLTARRPADRKRGEEVVRRARSRLGERSYNLLSNNCEHLCNWCHLVFFHSESAQVEALAPFEFFFWSALQRLLAHLARHVRTNAFEVSLA